MNQFQDTPVTDRETGRTFLYRSFSTPEEGAAFARLTFTNAALWAIGRVGDTTPTPDPVPINRQQTELF